jgi:hypothetical protein
LTVILPTQPSLRIDPRPTSGADHEPTRGAEHFEGIEFFKGDVWLSGRIERGRFRRLSDVLNHAAGGLLLRDAVICGVPTRPVDGTTHDTWIDLRDIDLVGQASPDSGPSRDGAFVPEHVVKRPQRLTAWTASHEIHGAIHLYPEADLASFLRSDDPPLIAMTDVEVSWVTSGRTTRRFPFVLLNRRRIFATRPG